MSVEAATYINQLVATNPLANDPKAEGDNHLRLLKQVLVTSFPNIAGVMSVSHSRLNLLNVPQLADVSAGTAPNFTVAAPQVPPTAYADNQLYFVTFHATGTTGSNTLNIKGLGAKGLKQYDHLGALVDAVIISGFTAVILYESSAGVFIVLNGLPATPPISEFAVGDYKDSDRATMPAGMRWLLCNGYTIGTAPSGATARANADVEELFTFLWNTHPEADIAMQYSSGLSAPRGASAAADWAAHKRLALPDWRGLYTRVYHGGSSTFATNTSRRLLELESDQNKAHTHSTPQGLFGGGGSFSLDVGGNSSASVSGSEGGLEVNVRNKCVYRWIRY
jgi:hypothetical protein